MIFIDGLNSIDMSRLNLTMKLIFTFQRISKSIFHFNGILIICYTFGVQIRKYKMHILELNEIWLGIKKMVL